MDSRGSRSSALDAHIMKTTKWRIAAAIAMTMILWFLVLLGSDSMPLNDPWLDEGRIFPYLHAHLREEWGWFPVLDSLFLCSAFLRNVIPYAVGAAFLRREGFDKRVFAFYLVSTIALLSLIFSLAPLGMPGAWGIESLFAVCGVRIGLGVRSWCDSRPIAAL